MSRGIYMMANDNVAEHMITMLNSVRFYDAEVPVVVIPYDEKVGLIGETIKRYNNVAFFPDPQFVKKLAEDLARISPANIFNKPNNHRKYACWFGPFDEFLYLDTDIVVFERIINNLRYLSEYDFLCCDYQHKGGIVNVFTEKIFQSGVLPDDTRGDIFNSGFLASKKGVIDNGMLYETFRECAMKTDYFDYSQKVTDQPLINYLVLKNISKRFNLAKGGAGSWAGSGHFVRDGNRLIDPNIGEPLKYLHWAGIKIESGCPYWDIWEYYRNLK